MMICLFRVLYFKRLLYNIYHESVQIVPEKQKRLNYKLQPTNAVSHGFQRRSQGVHWVHVHPQGGEKIWAKFAGESCKCTHMRRKVHFEEIGGGQIGETGQWQWLI